MQRNGQTNNRIDMSELRRHIMMQAAGGGGCPYITDGLIFWLDGLDYVSGSNWVDKIQGLEFIPATGNAANVNGGVYVNGDDNFKTNRTYPTGTILSIECSYDCPNGSKAFYPFVLEGGAQVVNMGNNSFYWKRGMMKTDIGIGFSAGKTFSANIGSSLVVVNKVQRTLGRTAFPTSRDIYAKVGACVGTRLDRYENAFWGTIYSIRGYDRNLTLEEMQFNQQVDNERFNLGLNI